MDKKMTTLRKLLVSLIGNIDAGNSNLTDEELDSTIDMVTKIAVKDVTYTKEQACRYLNISRATFDNYRRCGWLPNGKKELGGRLRWDRRDLDKCAEELRARKIIK